MRKSIIISIIIISLLILPTFSMADSSDEWSSSVEFDNGHKTDVTTSTDRYNQTAGTMELDFPYAEKDAVNLQSYWRLEDATDETGTNDGTMDGVTNTTGIFGDCFSFDGTNDRVSLALSGVTEDNSFSIWFKSSAFSTEPGLLMQTVEPSSGKVGLSIDTNDYIRYAFKNAAGTFKSVISDSNVLDNGNWHHVVGTYDGAIMRIYIDGVAQVDTEAQTGTLNAGSNNFQIGRYAFSGNL